MPLTTQWRNVIVDASVNGTAVAIWTPYLRLSTGSPALDGSGWVEVSAGYSGYAAITLANLMPAASGGSSQNDVQGLFPVPVTGGAVIAAIGVWDVSTGGTSTTTNLRAFIRLAPTVTISLGVQPRILVGALLFQ